MHLQQPLSLPCGAILPNRIAKSAMSENLSPRHHGPTPTLIRAYQRWVEGGCGLIITGNIMIDRRAIGEPGNVVVEDETDLELLKEWAAVVQNTKAHLWAQINHPGRQAMSGVNADIVAPSAVGLNVHGLSALFREPRALTDAEILELIERFGRTAAILKKAGFTGVQIHAAHGYLVSQFLSPLTNQRTDRWGGTLKNRARFVLEVYRTIRKQVGPEFPVGIKINSADFQRGGFTEEESMEVVRLLGAEGIDLIEISGGTYERPAMVGSEQRQSTREREAYFLKYVEKARSTLSTPLMLTGGFRTVATMEHSLAEGVLDVIGLARPFTIYPDLPRRIFAGVLTRLDVPTPKTGLKTFDNSGFVDIMWHELHIRRLGEGKVPDPKLSAYAVFPHNIMVTLKKLFYKLPFFKKGDGRGFG